MAKTSAGVRVLQYGTAILVTLLYFLPGWQHFSTHIFGGSSGDGGLYLTLLTEGCRSLFNGSNLSLSSFYPYQQTLAWSDNYLFPACLAAPALAVGVPLTIVHNSLMVLCVLGSFLCTQYLARTLGLSALGAIVAASSFALYQFLVPHLGHPQLQWTFVLPLTLAATIRSISAPSFFSGALLGAGLLLALTTSAYYFIFLVVLVPLLLIAAMRNQPAIDISRLRAFGLAAGGALISLAVASPLLAAYARAKDLFGGRGLHEANAFALSLASWVSPAPTSQMHPYLTSAIQDVEKTTWLGGASLALALLGICSLPLSHAALVIGTWVAALLSGVATPLSWIVVAIVLWAIVTKAVSLPTKLLLLGSLGIVFSFGAPDQFSIVNFLWNLVPGFDGARAVGRWSVVVSLFVALLAGMAVSRWRFLVLCLPLLLWEGTPRTFGLEPLPTPPNAVAGIPQGSVAIILPFSGVEGTSEQVSWSRFASHNTAAMLWAAQHHIRVVNGYSGVRTKLMEYLISSLQTFPSKASINALFGIADLSYVVVSKQLAESLLQFSERARDAGLEIVEESQDGSILLRLPKRIRSNSEINLLIPPGGAVRLYKMTVLSDEVKKDARFSVKPLEKLASAPQSTTPRWVKITGPVMIERD